MVASRLAENGKLQVQWDPCLKADREPSWGIFEILFQAPYTHAQVFAPAHMYIQTLHARERLIDGYIS